MLKSIIISPFKKLTIQSLMVWAILFSLSAQAEDQADDNVQVSLEWLSDSIEITARDAPLGVFIQALFVNSEMDVEVSDSIEGVVTGNYTGLISHVLSELATEFDLVSQTHDGVVKVLAKSQVPKRERHSRSIVLADTDTDTDTANANANANANAIALNAESKYEKNIEESVANQTENAFERPLQKSARAEKLKPLVKQKKTPELNEYVERVFVLKNAIAVDTKAGSADQPMIPGVVTQLEHLIEKLDVFSLSTVGADASVTTGLGFRVDVLPSMNAIVIKDIASRMPLYKDLIESLDVASSASSKYASDTLSQDAREKWQVVK